VFHNDYISRVLIPACKFATTKFIITSQSTLLFHVLHLLQLTLTNTWSRYVKKSIKGTKVNNFVQEYFKISHQFRRTGSNNVTFPHTSHTRVYVLFIIHLLRHVWHLVSRLVNTVWNSVIETFYIARVIKRSRHDSNATSTILACKVTLNRLMS
jgi:hypothetical protein